MGASVIAQAGADPSIRDMAALYGKRPDERRTRGTPARTTAMVVLTTLDKHLRAKYPERCWITGLDELVEQLADCWAGEDGQDIDDMIRALRATQAQTIHNGPPDRPPM